MFVDCSGQTQQSHPLPLHIATLCKMGSMPMPTYALSKSHQDVSALVPMLQKSVCRDTDNLTAPGEVLGGE